MPIVIAADPFAQLHVVNITDQLAQRPVGTSKYARQKSRMKNLVRQLGDSPQETVARLVAQAMEFCESESAGLALLDPATDEFKWHNVIGKIAFLNGATMPHDCPSRLCAEQESMVLLSHPETIYQKISNDCPPFPEMLMVPLCMADAPPLGTLWVVAPAGRHFHRDDARILTELSNFIAIGLHFKRFDGVRPHAAD